MSDNPARITPPASTGSVNLPQQGGASASGSITPEMVNAIADKVYQMLLLELKYGRERHPFIPHRPRGNKGGR